MSDAWKLKGLIDGITDKPATALSEADYTYFMRLVAQVHEGAKAVVIVAQPNDKLKFMFSNISRKEALSMLTKVANVTADKILNE